MNRMPNNARTLETLGDSIYRDENGNIHIKNKVFIDNSMELGNNTPIINGLRNITDDYGNKRFIEGTISVEEQTGLTINYGKWSLSGTHLMFVIAGTVAAGNTAEISLKTTFINLPSWILDKIYPLGTGDNVAYSTIYIFDNVTNEVSKEDAILIKSNVLNIYHHNAIGDSDNSVSFRLQLDLLIDSD